MSGAADAGLDTCFSFGGWLFILLLDLYFALWFSFCFIFLCSAREFRNVRMMPCCMRPSTSLLLAFSPFFSARGPLRRRRLSFGSFFLLPLLVRRVCCRCCLIRSGSGLGLRTFLSESPSIQYTCSGDWSLRFKTRTCLLVGVAISIFIRPGKLYLYIYICILLVSFFSGPPWCIRIRMCDSYPDPPTRISNRILDRFSAI